LIVPPRKTTELVTVNTPDMYTGPLRPPDSTLPDTVLLVAESNQVVSTIRVSPAPTINPVAAAVALSAADSLTGCALAKVPKKVLDIAFYLSVPRVCARQAALPQPQPFAGNPSAVGHCLQLGPDD